MLVEMDCGYNNKKVHNQFEYRVILKFELGIQNNPFEGEFENNTSSTKAVLQGFNDMDNVCTAAPIIKILSVLTTALELIKIIIMVVIKVRKQRRIMDIPLTPPSLTPHLNSSVHPNQQVSIISALNPEISRKVVRHESPTKSVEENPAAI